MDPNIERKLRRQLEWMADEMLRMQAAMLCNEWEVAELAELFKPAAERRDIEIAEAAIARARMRGID